MCVASDLSAAALPVLRRRGRLLRSRTEKGIAPVLENKRVLAWCGRRVEKRLYNCRGTEECSLRPAIPERRLYAGAVNSAARTVQETVESGQYRSKAHAACLLPSTRCLSVQKNADRS